MLKEEGGVVRIRMVPLREKGLLCIRVLDNGMGIEPEQLQQLRTALEQPAPRWEHIGIYNVVYIGIEDVDNYDDIYQSDLCGWVGQLGFNSGHIFGANVFSAQKAEDISAAGFYANKRVFFYIDGKLWIVSVGGRTKNTYTSLQQFISMILLYHKNKWM